MNLTPGAETRGTIKQEAFTAGRALIAAPFFVNGIAFVSQNATAEALAKAGLAKELVPWAIYAGRAVQLLGAFSVTTKVLPRLGSSSLMAFLFGATLIGHPFWKARDKGTREHAKASFFVNVGLFGALFYLFCIDAATRRKES